MVAEAFTARGVFPVGELFGLFAPARYSAGGLLPGVRHDEAGERQKNPTDGVGHAE